MSPNAPNLLRKLLCSVANLALVMALVSVSSTCCFLSYQPDIPDELKNFNS